MVLDSYTQYNQGGIGASITNQGYAQLVSLFTICDDIANLYVEMVVLAILPTQTLLSVIMD